MKRRILKLINVCTLNYYMKRKQKNQLLILMFHQVNDKKSTFYPAMSVTAFKDLCLFVKSNYAVITPSQIEGHFNKSNESAAILSFDDGHYDIIEHALPILSQLDLPFNVNIDTEILETEKPQDFVRVYDILNNTNIEGYINDKFMTSPIKVDRSNPIATENDFTELLSKLSSDQKKRNYRRFGFEI